MINGFSIGDKIIYPTQGIGVIEDIQDEQLYGESFSIYRLRIISNDTLIMVPSINTQEIGIRKLASESNIEKVFSFIGNGEIDVSKNWKGRYKEHQCLMKTGSLQDVAVVLKSLYFLNLTKPLSFREKKMMEKALEMLATEISEVADSEMEDIERRILNNLAECFKEIPEIIDS